MLDLSKSTIIDTRTYPPLSSLTTIEEGSALVGVMESSVLKAKPSAGSAGEFFLGVAQYRRGVPTESNLTVETVVPATGPYTVTLAKTPVGASSVKVYIAGAAATQGTPAAGVYSISGTTLTFHSSDAGKALKIVYRFALTVSEATFLYGNDMISNQLIPGVEISAISTGVVYTDMFVITDTWETLGTVYLGASGKFTLQSGGTAIDAVVVATPSTANGFLGLSLKP